MVPHLNELKEKFEAKGLSVIGVTGAAAGQTDPWIREQGATYAYAYDKGGALSRSLGVSGIPHAFIVNPQGKIVWRGHPASLKAETIEEHLAGALKTPVWDWPKHAKPVRSNLSRQRYAKALDAAQKLVDQGLDMSQEIHDAVSGVVKGKLEALESAFKSGDYLSTRELGKELSKSLAGLREADRVKEILADLKATPDARKVMRAQKKVRKLREEMPRRKKDALSTLKDLRRISEKHPGTAAAREADAYAEEIQKILPRMR